MSAKEALGMSDDRRALLTDREREILETDGADVSEKYYGVVVTRVRNKIGQLENDLPALERHDTLGEELRDVVCAGDESATHTARERSASQDDRDTTPDDERRDVGTRAESGAENHRDVLRAGLSGSGDLLERRVDAILAMYDYLREHGEATNDELQALADPDVVDYAHAESVWSNMVKGKGTLQALPGVEKPGDGRNAPWKYRGDDTDA